VSVTVTVTAVPLPPCCFVGAAVAAAVAADTGQRQRQHTVGAIDDPVYISYGGAESPQGTLPRLLELKRSPFCPPSPRSLAAPSSPLQVLLGEALERLMCHRKLRAITDLRDPDDISERWISVTRYSDVIFFYVHDTMSNTGFYYCSWNTHISEAHHGIRVIVDH